MTTATKPLIEKQAALVLQSRQILDLCETEKRGLSTDEQANYDKLESEIDGLGTTIAAHNKQAERDANLAAENLKIAEQKKISEEENLDEGVKERKAFSDFLRNGPGGMSADSRKIITRANQSTTDAEGGYGIPTTVSTSIITALRSYGGVEGVANVITTATGNDMNFPTVDSTGVDGEWLAEASSAATGDETFGVKAIEAWKAGSKWIKVSNELMQDAAFDLVGWIETTITTRIGRLTNAAYTVGDGSSKPHGFVSDTASGVTAASDTAVTADELIDLYMSLDPAYTDRATFMFNNTTLGAIRKLKDGNSQYLWQPGGLGNSQDATLLWRPYVVNQDMVDMASTTQSIACGDFGAYLVRHVSGMGIKRVDELFAANDQVGFIAFMRVDGRLLAANATTYNPVKTITQAT